MQAQAVPYMRASGQAGSGNPDSGSKVIPLNARRCGETPSCFNQKHPIGCVTLREHELSTSVIALCFMANTSGSGPDH